VDSKISPLERVEARIAVLSRQLQESEQRNSNYREEVDALQERVSRLLAQLREPQSLDEVIHPRP